MAKQKSFSRVENNVRHAFRNSLNIADSTEDVKKFFVYAMQDLVDQAFEGRVTFEYEDIALDLNTENGFILSENLRQNKEFAKAFANSDLPQIFARLAENAMHYIRHFEDKHPDKTEAKMYPTPDHSGHFFRNPPVKKGGKRQ